MSKPFIAELLQASGHNEFTEQLVQRAVRVLYGNVGANLDERNWSAIMQSSNPLQAAEAGLVVQYQDSSYLLRNTRHLEQNGYVAAQAELTYRHLADRLGFTYEGGWSKTSSYEKLGGLTDSQLVDLLPPPPPPAPPPPAPAIAVSGGSNGLTVALNVAGTVTMSVSGSLGSFAAGGSVLTEQTSLKEGFLTLADGGDSSVATSQYVVLGTSGNDTVDLSALASRVDFIFGGAGADTLNGGAGNDFIHGGSGDDIITGGTGIDRLTGGAGQDRFQQNQGDSAYPSDADSTIANRTSAGSLDDGDILKFPNGQIDIVTDFDSTKDVIDASVGGTYYTDGRTWANYIRGQGHYARGNWDGSELFTIDYAAGTDILYFVSLNGANLAFNAFDIANGGIILVGAGSTGFTAANIV